MTRSRRWRFAGLRLAVMLGLMLVAASCGSAPLAETSSRTPAGEETNGDESPTSTSVSAATTPPPSDPPVALPTTQPVDSTGDVVRIFFPNKVAWHESGSQAWLRQMERSAMGVRATVEVINASGTDQQYDDAVFLSFDGEQVAGMWEPQIVEPGTNRSLVAEFRIDAGTEVDAFSLALNVDEGGQPSTLSRRPSFMFDVESLAASTEQPNLPRGFPVTLATASLSGVTAGVTDVSFGDSRIGVGIVAANMRSTDRHLGGGSSETYLVDDLGNRYSVIEQPTNRRFSVGRFERLEGQLVFAGRLHPDAVNLTLVINDDSDQANEFSAAPFFSFGPIPLDGTAPALGVPEVIAAGERQVHPNSVEVAMETLVFADPQVTVSIVATNNRSGQTSLNSVSSTVLLDDRGNRYPLAESPRNESLDLDGGQTASISLVFAGPVDPFAMSFTLLLNDRGEEYLFDDSTISPAFIFGPYDVSEREAPAAGVTVEVAQVSNVETVAFDARTQIDG